MANRNDLSAQAEQDRLDFLQTDLDLCFTFADLIITELGLQDREAAEGLLAKAEQGYATIEYFLPKVCNEGEHQALQQRLAIPRFLYLVERSRHVSELRRWEPGWRFRPRRPERS